MKEPFTVMGVETEMSVNGTRQCGSLYEDSDKPGKEGNKIIKGLL